MTNAGKSPLTDLVRQLAAMPVEDQQHVLKRMGASAELLAPLLQAVVKPSYSMRLTVLIRDVQSEAVPPTVTPAVGAFLRDVKDGSGKHTQQSSSKLQKGPRGLLGQARELFARGLA